MNWAYLAGFTDGDGHISFEIHLPKSRHYIRIAWAQKATSSCVLDAIAAFLREQGFKVTEKNFTRHVKCHKYPQRRLVVFRVNDVLATLEGMLPHLVLKKKQAEEGIKLLQQVKALKAQYGVDYRIEMVRLKHD